MQEKNSIDGDLVIEKKIKDLLSKMTLEEKVRQLDQYAGGDFTKMTGEADGGKTMEIDWERLSQVNAELGFGAIQNRNGNAKVNNQIQKYVIEHTRLGIPVLFAEEGLHGFFQEDCTAFPQQIALASTFSRELAEKTGHAIAKEAAALGTHEVWAPVLDVARDPRWGRTEEGYGEDTYLSAALGSRFVKGMQGEDVSAADRVASEPKHFSGYGGPVGGLNCMPAAYGKQEHAMFALPVFEAAFAEAGALNTMCSYSSIDGIPCASDSELLTETLREKWGMKGFVRSDMCAIAMLHSGHDTAETKEESIRQALEAGVDMQLYDYPHDFYQTTIADLVKTEKVSMETLERAVSRVLYVKFRLGLFDHPYTDENLEDVIHCKEHRDISLESARKGICLLKNNGILPLKKDYKKIAIIGPGAKKAMLGDYLPETDKQEQEGISLYDGIKAIVSEETQLLYAKGCNFIESGLIPIPSDWLKTKQGVPGLDAAYYNNAEEPSGEVALNRVDAMINFNWIYYKPADCVDAKFSVRWTGILKPDVDIEVYIGLSSMDSMRLYIDDSLIVDGWGDKDATGKVPFHFEKGKEHQVTIEFRNDNRGVQVVFGYALMDEWEAEAVKIAKEADIAIVTLGDNRETSGENFDRCELNLPGKQLDLLKALYAVKTPIVLVLQSGRPMTITWESQHLPAIIEAWFVGEKGGQAMAEILFGEVNPSGKLPISFPRHVGQLPVHYNRKAAGGKKYLETDWNPLYPFGYGLSYTDFFYHNLVLSAKTIGVEDSITVRFDVTNTGKCQGDEIVQLYLNDYYSSAVRPVKELRGFERVSLAPMETKTVTMTLGYKELRTLTPDYRWVVEPGEMGIFVGASSMDIRLNEDFRIV